MQLGRLEKYIIFSFILHLLLLLVLPRLLPKSQKKPSVFEVAWVDPSSSKIKQDRSVKTNTLHAQAHASRAQVRLAPSLKKSKKPKLNLQSAPLGSGGGQLALGEGKIRPQGPSPLMQGGTPTAPAPTGLAPEQQPGTPLGLTSEMFPAGKLQGDFAQKGVLNKLEAQALPNQQGESPGPGQEKRKSDMIEGEVRGRPVIFHPKAPVLDIERNVTVTLRFIVLANGSVEQIIAIKKSDPRLEALAIELLGQYRFLPVEGAEPQSGVIHFILHRSQ